MTEEIKTYHDQLSAHDKAICHLLAHTIDHVLTRAESKIWHAHPVWFLDGNPIVGYSRQKAGIRLMFWSGADFDEDDLHVRGEKFRDASIFYTQAAEVDTNNLKRWLQKSIDIQWDYKNLVKRKGRLEKLIIQEGMPPDETLQNLAEG
jgi:uncharacterized protein YdhG (YjbR/CyaY superfamily)